MSTVITERAVLLLNASADIEDSSSEAGKIFTNLLATVAAQPGFISGHWGRRVCIDKNDVEHIVDWESLEAHENLNNNPSIIEPMMAELEKIMRAEPPWYHINYYQQSSGARTRIPASAFLSPTKAPVTEMVVMHLSTTISESDISTLQILWAGFAKDVLEKADGCFCVGQGMVMEELERDGRKVKGFHVAIGWENEEQCKVFNDETGVAAFERNVGALIKGRESCLVRLKAQ